MLPGHSLEYSLMSNYCLVVPAMYQTTYVCTIPNTYK